VASDQGESDAVKSFYYSLEAEKIYSKLFSEAKEVVEKSKDYELEYVSICEKCGHTVKDGTPDQCPIHGVKKDRFKKFHK
jgi:rubrerythrin